MFSARRRPKRIVREEHDRPPNNEQEEQEQKDGPVVRRPAAPVKSKSKLRTSFAPDEAEDSSDAPVVIKAKPRMGHVTSTQALPRFNLESRGQDENASRPSYSKTALEELRNSTPSTPKELSIYDPSSGAEDGLRDLDITSQNDGAQLSVPDVHSHNSVGVTAATIPSATEIAEKKARRARLAKEQGSEDFIPLEDDTQLYDSDGEFKPRRMQVGAYLRRPDPIEADTRLVRDDEDVLEGFDEFTEDAGSKRITMGRKQLLQEQRRDRKALRELIDQAEGGHYHDRHHHHHNTNDDKNVNDNDDISSSESASDSEIERNQAYETAQTAHGMDGLSGSGSGGHMSAAKINTRRPRPPREVTPIPKLATALAKLRERMASIELERVKIERRRAEIRTERAEVKASQEHIQRSLVEAGEKLEEVQRRQQQQQQQQADAQAEVEVEVEVEAREGGGGRYATAAASARPPAGFGAINADNNSNYNNNNNNGYVNFNNAGTAHLSGRGLDSMGLHGAEPT